MRLTGLSPTVLFGCGWLDTASSMIARNINLRLVVFRPPTRPDVGLPMLRKEIASHISVHRYREMGFTRTGPFVFPKNVPVRSWIRNYEEEQKKKKWTKAQGGQRDGAVGLSLRCKAGGVLATSTETLHHPFLTGINCCVEGSTPAAHPHSGNNTRKKNDAARPPQALP